MSELVAFIFSDQFRAPEVLNELRRRDFTWSRDLDEAVAVTLDKNGNPRVQLSVDLSTHEGAGWARLWGSLLSSTLFLPGGTDAIVAAASALDASNGKTFEALRSAKEKTLESSWWQEALARSVNFKRDVAALMEPCASAIFLILRAGNAPVVLKQLRNYGDTIVHTSLTAEQDKKMLALLALSKEYRS